MITGEWELALCFGFIGGVLFTMVTVWIYETFSGRFKEN
jgi:hypothetical protein